MVARREGAKRRRDCNSVNKDWVSIHFAHRRGKQAGLGKKYFERAMGSSNTHLKILLLGLCYYCIIIIIIII